MHLGSTLKVSKCSFRGPVQPRDGKKLDRIEGVFPHPRVLVRVVSSHSLTEKMQ